MLQLKNISKIYTAGKETKALDGINLNFGESGLVFITGKSGSGKSTLLNLIGGLDSPTDGEFIIDGKSSRTFTERDFDNYRNTYIGFVFQEYNLISDFTAGENVIFSFELQGEKQTREIVDGIFKKIRLTDGEGKSLYDRKINELSGGQKQRTALARALIKNPQIILADEPTGALDSETGENIFKILKEISSDKLVIAVTHDEEKAERYGDRIIKLCDGKTVSDTGETGETHNRKDCSFKDGKLPLKRIFTIATRWLKHKIARRVISVILSVITLLICGASVTAAFCDETEIQLKTMYSYKSYNADVTSVIPFNDEQLNILRDYTGRQNPSRVFRIIYREDKIYNMEFENYVGATEEQREYDVLYNTAFATIGEGAQAMEINCVTGEKDFNLRKDERLSDKSSCRLPERTDEIAITDLCASAFMRFGYKNEDGNVQAITSPDDLIGKKLGSFTICEIYSTETDRTIFERIGVSTGEEEARLPNGEYLHDSGSSIISRYFVCENYLAKIDDSTDFRIAIRLTGNLHKDKTLFEQLAGNEKGYIISLFSPYRGDLSTIRIFGEKVFIAADAGILIAFTLFSILLTANTISAGLEFRNKDIGIMRALGAKKSEITRICLAENIITAAIEFILSSIGVAVIAAVANSAFRMQVFGVNAFTLLSIFALSVAVSAIATVIPARKAAAKNPVDAINGI